MYIIVASIFFIASGIGLGVMVWRYREELRSFDPQRTQPRGKYGGKKASIIEERVRRKVLDRFRVLGNSISPLLRVIKKSLHVFHTTLVEKERMYRDKIERQSLFSKTYHERKNVIAEKLEDTQMVEDDAEREQQYLGIIALDSKNIEAYSGLAELYLEQKNYNEARELFSHLEKLGSKTIEHYLDWTRCLYGLQLFENARDVLQRAHAIEPKNPKVIDKLIDVAILLGDKRKAREYIKQLKIVNPDNQKVVEYTEMIKKIRKR